MAAFFETCDNVQNLAGCNTQPDAPAPEPEPEQKEYPLDTICGVVADYFNNKRAPNDFQRGGLDGWLKGEQLPQGFDLSALKDKGDF